MPIKGAFNGPLPGQSHGFSAICPRKKAAAEVVSQANK